MGALLTGAIDGSGVGFNDGVSWVIDGERLAEGAVVDPANGVTDGDGDEWEAGAEDDAR